MPTPSPIIVASVGATVGTSATWLISVMIDRPLTSPTMAVMIGSPIATTVPKVSSSTITAMPSPTTSLEWVSGFETFCPTYPAKLTSRPACASRVRFADDPLGVVGRQLARARAEVERDVADPLVLGQDVLALAGQGARGVPDGRVLLEGPPRAAGQRGVAVLHVPGREDARPVGGDGDGELEVGGQRAVLGVDRPAVVAHAHAVAPGVDHRLDGEDHALLEQGAAAGVAVVGDLRVLVHRAPDAVADERAHDAQAVALHARLHGVRDVAQAVARAALLDGVEERGLGRVQQLAGHRRDRADREGARGVGHPAVEDRRRRRSR